MIEYIFGKLSELTPATATIETTGGVAYLLNISLNTFSALEEAAANAPHDAVRLYAHEAIREDAWTLYGFFNRDERALFRELIGVSGVGAAMARVILSSHTVAELQSIIAGGDIKALKQVKGIGAKTAERIIVDLRDKIKPDDITLLNAGTLRRKPNQDVYDEALAALVMLGFANSPVKKALDRLFEAEPSLRVEDAIKKALGML